MSDTQMSSNDHVLEEWTTPGGIRVRLWSGDAWSRRNGQGNHATLSTRPLKMPDAFSTRQASASPELELEDPDAALESPAE
jgi:hypothetical protein